MNETTLFITIVAAVLVANIINQLILNPLMAKLFGGTRKMQSEHHAQWAKTSEGMSSAVRKQ
jgi:hypothetical protein